MSPRYSRAARKRRLVSRNKRERLACATHPLSGGRDRSISYATAGCLFTSHAFASVCRVVTKPAHLIRVRPDRCFELFPIMPGHIGRTEYVETGITVSWSRN